jgi:hypothetical protein
MKVLDDVFMVLILGMVTIVTGIMMIVAAVSSVCVYVSRMVKGVVMEVMVVILEMMVDGGITEGDVGVEGVPEFSANKVMGMATVTIMLKS